MTASSSPEPTPVTAVRWPRAELVLVGVAVLSLVSLLISVGTVWSGLPAHPLMVHVPVVLIPLSIVGALAVSARPRWFEPYGVLLCLCAIVGMSSVFLAENAGGRLQALLRLHGRAAQLVNQHASAANVLALLFAGFTAFLLVDFAAHRIGGSMPTGVVVIDRVLGHPRARLILRVVVVVLGLLCAFYVYRVGDLGAKAVWQQRLAAAPGGLVSP